MATRGIRRACRNVPVWPEGRAVSGLKVDGKFFLGSGHCPELWDSQLAGQVPGALWRSGVGGAALGRALLLLY